MKEIWKDIKGYENLYQVSNLGNVRSLITYKYSKKERMCIKVCRERILKPGIDKNNYKCVVLTKDKNRKTYKVHKLVAKCFVKNIENKPFVNHIDGNKLNNNANNLEWTTNSENIKHAYDNNLIDIRKKQKKVNQYDLKGNFIKQWNSMKEAGETLNICRQNISQCCRKVRNKANGYIWRYANGN